VLARNLLDELVVGNGVAKPADHCCHLTVKDGRGYQVAEVEDDFDVLPRGMENLDHLFVGHQAEEGCEVQSGRESVHKRRVVGRGHLDKAQFRPERRFADELRIDCDEIGFGEGGYGLFEGLCRRNKMHGYLLEKARPLVAKECAKRAV